MFIHHPQVVLIMYAKLTKLIKWTHLYRVVVTIDRLKPLGGGKMRQVDCIFFLRSWDRASLIY